MTGNNDCPHNKSIDCPYLGAVIFCKKCGYYPSENARRKEFINQHSADLETARQENVIQLNIKHSKRKVTYNLRRVRKRTSSPKTNSQLKNQQGVG